MFCNCYFNTGRVDAKIPQLDQETNSHSSTKANAVLCLNSKVWFQPSLTRFVRCLRLWSTWKLIIITSNAKVKSFPAVFADVYYSEGRRTKCIF